MRWLLIGAMLALMIMLAVSHAVATDDAKVNNTTGHVETGGKKIGDGKFVKVVDETAKGISKTVVERKKFAANSSPTGRFPMPRRAFGLVDAELSRRIASILRTQLFKSMPTARSGSTTPSTISERAHRRCPRSCGESSRVKSRHRG